MVAPHSLHDDAQAFQCQHTFPDGRSSLRGVGYVRGSAPVGVDCEQPVRLVCVQGCGYADAKPCEASRSGKCRPCATRYRRRVRSLAQRGMFRQGGFHYFVTLTAPSDEGEHCKKAGCDNAPWCTHEICSCTPMGGVDLAEWNASAAKRWNHFLTLLERTYGVRPQFFRGTEAQEKKRYALHHHVLLWVPVALDKRVLRRLAIQAGFGHEIDVEHLAAGSSKAAHYVAKYVSKSCSDRAAVPWVGLQPKRLAGVEYVKEVLTDEDGVEQEQTVGHALRFERPVGPCAPTFRSWSQSRRWGTSMAAIKDVERRKWLGLYGSPAPLVGESASRSEHRDRTPP